MAEWNASECEMFYADSRVAVTELCRVSIGEGQITIRAAEPDFVWRYQGVEVEPNQFRLECKTHTGGGTLSYFKDGNILEGGWEEEENGIQARGMWRFILGLSEDE